MPAQAVPIIHKAAGVSEADFTQNNHAFCLLLSRFMKIQAQICYSVYLEVSWTNRERFTHAVTGVASKVW